MRRTLILPSVLSLSLAALAAWSPQGEQPTATAQETHPKAAPEDVESIEAILASLYEVISGDIDEERDWDRFRSLFHPEMGQQVPLRYDPKTSTWRAQPMSPNEYAEQAARWMKTTPFWEREISRKIDRFGSIAHVWSTYAGFNDKDAKEPFVRGINSIQLMNDGKRWWLMTVAWDPERDDQPLPKKYLPTK